jgi:hypothetical protein
MPTEGTRARAPDAPIDAARAVQALKNGPMGALVAACIAVVRKEPAILFTHLMEGIGLALDRKDGRMFITDLSGSVYTDNLDGSDKKTLLYGQGNPTGMAYAEIPATNSAITKALNRLTIGAWR